MSLLAYGFALILIGAGIYHFVNPQFYHPFMPAWFPKDLANIAGGGAEILIGIAMLVPATRVAGLYAAAGLMLVFLPLHVIDLLRDRPLMGSKLNATIRLIIQVVLIGWLFYSARNYGAGPIR
ncbi:hypothetical protein LEM8419_01436 [Neolewinella maritima]|uniref:Methylamine utilisation protein MauE domain-containing protein n=1 Tax=Neolewinella maritima TaxID=1383882 RepID=A0ABM9B0H6_9BACT|nr:MauE/DoxX family redox-associated membrane protein [Neolewinella maritima]CAH1000285.1 hypothetical protein LEM8419_01436 [Neolewinella maritima]